MYMQNPSEAPVRQLSDLNACCFDDLVVSDIITRMCLASDSLATLALYKFFNKLNYKFIHKLAVYKCDLFERGMSMQKKFLGSDICEDCPLVMVGVTQCHPPLVH